MARTAGSPGKGPTPAAALATPGYAVASIDYRSDADTPIASQVADAKAAVRWLRANASRFNIDPTKVGVFGHDTGGTIAAILGTAGDVAALEGDLGNPGQSSRVQAVVTLAGSVNRAATLSPLTHVSKDDAPTLILHGTADTEVPDARESGARLRAESGGRQCHARAPDWRPARPGAILSPLAMQQVTAFFDQQLRGARRATGTSSYLSTPLTEYVDPVAIDLGGALYKTYPTPVRGPGTYASYRIYLPPDYETSGTRRYPVIYFMHGRSSIQSGPSWPATWRAWMRPSDRE